MKMIRKMKTEDIESVQRIAKTTWRDTYKGIMNDEFIEEFIKVGYSKKMIKSRARDTIFIVAVYDEQVVGFTNFISNYFGNNQSVLAAIYIEPRYQRKGFGTMLLNNVIEQLPQSSKLFADIERQNKGCRKFFETKGFMLHKNINAKIGNHQFDRIRVVLET
ncbi:L-amino acid N-acyltransferase YncA [Peribacillus simplex]